MALIDDIKVALRVVSEKTDSEVQTLIDAALYDMGRAGVNPELLAVGEDGGLANAFVRKAVVCYCKADYGYDNPEAQRFRDAYERVVNDLLNSSENIAAVDADRIAEGGGE